MRGANTNMTISAPNTLNPREKALEDYRKRMKEHKELSAKLKQSNFKISFPINEFKFTHYLTYSERRIEIVI
jgi:hypothetical protein